MADPAEPRAILDDKDSPAAPTDCRVATRLPAETPPPLAMAAMDIILAASEEAAIPVPVKPMAPRTTGTAPTVRTPPVTTAAALTPIGAAATEPTFSAPSRGPTAEATGARTALDIIVAPPIGAAAEVTAENPDRKEPTVDATGAREAWDTSMAPCDERPARRVPQAAPPASAMVTADVNWVAREEASMLADVRAMLPSRKLLFGPNLVKGSPQSVEWTPVFI